MGARRIELRPAEHTRTEKVDDRNRLVFRHRGCSIQGILSSESGCSERRQNKKRTDLRLEHGEYDAGGLRPLRLLLAPGKMDITSRLKRARALRIAEMLRKRATYLQAKVRILAAKRHKLGRKKGRSFVR